MKKIINSQTVELRQGKLWINECHRFLKIGKPQLNFSIKDEIDAFITDLPMVKDKGFDCLELNCYWHHMDPDGDGKIEVDLQPLNRLIEAIADYGLFPCLSVETYGVGGGQIPSGFWKSFPNALAVNHKGEKVRDNEYGYDTAVPSLFDEDYLRVSRAFIRDLVANVDHQKILWFETTVEPQFMGNQWLDYSPMARKAYEDWLKREGLDGPHFPESFPVPESFLNDLTWNAFRAEWLANWVNGDASAFRDIAGLDAWIASDYLDAEEQTMPQRCGNPLIFLRHLTAPNILQVNWTWHVIERRPNLKAYDRVKKVMKETYRDWAVTEHMTINGTDYHEHEIEALLRNTIKSGTLFGWEFVDILPDRDDPTIPPGTVVPGSFKPIHFSVYESNWKPKSAMAVIDDRWSEWLREIQDGLEKKEAIDSKTLAPIQELAFTE